MDDASVQAVCFLGSRHVMSMWREQNTMVKLELSQLCISGPGLLAIPKSTVYR